MPCPDFPRLILEEAAERDPDTYVPVLDLLDGDSDFEDDEREAEPVEGGDELSHVNGIAIVEYCPCCGNVTGREY